MKTIIFSTLRKPLLTFEAEEANLAAVTAGDSPEFLLTGRGQAIQQEMPAIEEMTAGDYTCYFIVSENGEEQLHAKCTVMLIAFEANQLVARIRLGK